MHQIQLHVHPLKVRVTLISHAPRRRCDCKLLESDTWIADGRIRIRHLDTRKPDHQKKEARFHSKHLNYFSYSSSTPPDLLHVFIHLRGCLVMLFGWWIEFKAVCWRPNDLDADWTSLSIFGLFSGCLVECVTSGKQTLKFTERNFLWFSFEFNGQ